MSVLILFEFNMEFFHSLNRNQLALYVLALPQLVMMTLLLCQPSFLGNASSQLFDTRMSLLMTLSLVVGNLYMIYYVREIAATIRAIPRPDPDTRRQL